ncbi:MAG: hypothetical protein HQK55_13150 [Deltaproteobacteria bacterium]|nr:hypothetical protein [Deltaproteobacteria bacterium]
MVKPKDDLTIPAFAGEATNFQIRRTDNPADPREDGGIAAVEEQSLLYYGRSPQKQGARTLLAPS